MTGFYEAWKFSTEKQKREAVHLPQLLSCFSVFHFVFVEFVEYTFFYIII